MRMGRQFLRFAYFLVITLLMFASTGCGGGGNSSTPSTPNVAPVPERITFSDSGDLGIFDPSITRDTTSGQLWMSYSSINTSPNYASTVYWSVSLRLAFSDDNGISWQDAGVVVSPAVERTADLGPMTAAGHPSGIVPAGSTGIWQSEMSSLIYDSHPSTPANERWKLIWVQYLHANATSLWVDYSWIAMKTAATPSGLAAATPIKLFGGVGLQAQNNITVSPVFSPTAGAPAIQLNTGLTQVGGGPDVTELNLCIFAEPGLHATNSAIYMAIYCADAATTPLTEYLVYFRCNSPCTMTNAASWQYLGRLASPTDTQAATGDHHYQAPAWVEKNGKTYLIVTPVNTTSASRYNGCRVYEFTDINNNQLLRNNGTLVEVARIDGDTNTHNGACAGFSDLSGGILLSQLGATGTTDAFKIYKSQVSLP